MFRVKVRVRDRCVKGLKCLRTEVTIHQFGPIYPSEIIAIVQCMYADYVVWDDGSDGLVDDFLMVGWEWGSFSGNGQICYCEEGVRQA